MVEKSGLLQYDHVLGLLIFVKNLKILQYIIDKYKKKVLISLYNPYDVLSVEEHKLRI
jgi:hypothetical protein